jgi:hypothetical protein
MLTDKAVEKTGCDYTVVCEEFEYDKYVARCGKDRVVVMPDHYLDDYDAFDDLGRTKSKGPGAARNFCIDHSRSLGFKRHWVMDDNMDDFYRLNRNERIRVRSGAAFRACEDFVDRYSNVPVAGMNYRFFCASDQAYPPFTVNTRIYSCLLIENDAGYRWRGRYNEDTDLTLRVLKDGNCTIQFNAFLCGKLKTQVLRGGNSGEFYDKEGTMNKSQMLVDMHPDVARVVWKYDRWHHHVDYSPWKRNKLIKIDHDHPTGINEYGMELRTGFQNPTE